MSRVKQQKPQPSANRPNEAFVRPTAMHMAKMNRENPTRAITNSESQQKFYENPLVAPSIVQAQLEEKDRAKHLKSSLFQGNQQLFYSLNRGTEFDQGKGHLLGIGSTGDYVILIQKALNLLFQNDPTYTSLVEEKDFGELTRKGVVKFQKQYNLLNGSSGVVGPETILRLDEEVAKVEKMTLDPNELFAIELINEAIRKRKPNDAGAINFFWNWYHSLKTKPSYGDLANHVASADFSYLDSKESRLLMFGLSSGSATMLSKAGKLDDSQDAMQLLMNMTEKEKEEVFKNSTEETIAILLMEFATGKGEKTRKFNMEHQMTNDIRKGATTAYAYSQFFEEIKQGKVKEGEFKYYYQGYHNRASGALESIRIHLQSLMLDNYGEFFRGGMEYWMKIDGDDIVVTAKDKYTEDSGIRNEKSRERIGGFETPFGTTYIELRWRIPIKGTLLGFKGLDYYNKK